MNFQIESFAIRSSLGLCPHELPQAKGYILPNNPCLVLIWITVTCLFLKWITVTCKVGKFKQILLDYFISHSLVVVLPPEWSQQQGGGDHLEGGKGGEQNYFRESYVRSVSGSPWMIDTAGLAGLNTCRFKI